MPKLFTATVSAALCCLLVPTAQALDDLCPVPVKKAASANMAEADPEQLHQAMQAAINSATQQMDWVQTPGNACGGYYLQPENPNPQSLLPPEEADVLLSAENVDQQVAGVLLLTGNVEMYQGQRRLRCDTMYLNREQQRSTLSGNIQMREQGLLLMADEAVFDGLQHSSYFLNAAYLLHEQQARGQSARIEISGQDDKQIRLEDTSFTLCPPTAEHWSFEAASLEIDQQKGWGTLRSAVFNVADVPVFYIPWLNFPVDDRRKTGVLWPSISGSGSNVDIALPVYFNLAPNYDVTYTPRINGEHGYLHNIEGRYKHRYSEWAIGGSFIDNDRHVGGEKTDRNPALDDQRWLAFVKEQGRFNAHWTTAIDYQSVSDIHYFRDWGTTGLDVQKSLNIKRQAQLQFNSSDWSASARLIDYQNLEQDPLTNKAMDEEYRQLPVIDVFYRNRLRSFTLEPLFQAQYSYFDHDSWLTGQRLYLEPGISLPLRWQALEMIPTARLKSVQFFLDNDNTAAQAHEPGSEYSGRHGEQVPTFGLDSRLFFERRDGDSQSILSPRLFYYYAHYRDQSDLPNFDTEAMAFSYQQLWRENRLSGFDRISDANQLSWGLENQWLHKGRTVFDAGIGQILYFSNRKVTAHRTDRQLQTFTGTETADERRIKQQINHDIRKDYFRSASDIALQSNWYPAAHHTVRGDVLIDPYDKRISETAIGYHYRDDRQRIFNLAYRYQYQPLLLDNGQAYKQHTDQLDGSFYLPLNQQWQVYLRTNVDITRNELIENISGLKYESCCWGVMLAFKRERKTFENNSRILDTADATYQNSWYIQFELKGLGGVTDTINRLLEESIQGFR